MADGDYTLRVRLTPGDRALLARLAAREGEDLSTTTRRILRAAASRAGMLLPDGTPAPTREPT